MNTGEALNMNSKNIEWIRLCAIKLVDIVLKHKNYSRLFCKAIFDKWNINILETF